MSKETRERKLQVRLTAEDQEAFAMLAQREGHTTSSLLRKLVRMAIKEVRTFDQLPKVSDEKCDFGVTVRLKLSEKQALSELAAEMGMSQQRTFVALLRSTVGNASLITKSEQDALLETRHELYKLGVNLNQIARAINTERKAGTFKASTVNVDELIAEAKAARATIDRMNNDIIRLMKTARTRIPFEVKQIDSVTKRSENDKKQ